MVSGSLLVAQAAVAEATERRKAEGAMQSELVSSREQIASLESKLATASTKLASLEVARDKEREESERELRKGA